jgi:hypothetical protein
VSDPEKKKRIIQGDMLILGVILLALIVMAAIFS